MDGFEAPSIHGSAIVVGTEGVLIRGPSGSGKSQLARALLDAARVEGIHGRWIADDRVLLRTSNGWLLATAPDPIRGQAEMRHVVLMSVTTATSGCIDRVVDLVPDMPERMPDPTSCNLHNIELPLLLLPQRQTDLNAALVRCWIATLQR